MRSEGKTYAEILAILKISVPKSTLSDWCKNVPLPSSYLDKINSLNASSFNKARKMAWISNRIKREKLLATLELENQVIIQKIKEKDKDFLKLALSFLYLGEGAKWESHSGAMLGSSDPDIIRLYI